MLKPPPTCGYDGMVAVSNPAYSMNWLSRNPYIKGFLLLMSEILSCTTELLSNKITVNHGVKHKIPILTCKQDL